MNRRKKLRTNKIRINKKAFLLLTILCLGVGFSYLTSNLTIRGNTSVSGNSFDIYFTNIQVNNQSVSANEPTITNKTTVNYTVTFEKPGDFYEFTVDCVNGGTIDAMIDGITKSGVNSELSNLITYQVTYDDDSEIAQGDVLRANKKTVYKVLVKYRNDISEEDLLDTDFNLNLTFSVTYIQATTQLKQSEFVKLVQSSAQSDSSINFQSNSSASNGNGLYIRKGTEKNDYPIYYYRGAVTNNNAKFAGYCWKIVRTTETGGTKLIYNGIPNGSGQCTNTTGDATQIGGSTFSSDISSPAYNGYMYGTVYGITRRIVGLDYTWGNSFTYENGTYTLKDTARASHGTNNTHYTCFNDSGKCSTLIFAVYVSGGSAPIYTISLQNGDSISDAFNKMWTGTNNSVIKTKIDGWFEENIVSYFTNLGKPYQKYFDDTIWCNDRSESSPSGWNPTGVLNTYMYYGANNRIGNPSLNCSNKLDSFTESDIENGNGSLTYPVGLLTTDEVNLAGGTTSNNTSFYLYTNQNQWLLTPHHFDVYAYRSYNYYLKSSGGIGDNTSNTSYSVRPSISIAPTVKIASGGDGSSATPYEFIVE